MTSVGRPTDVSPSRCVPLLKGAMRAVWTIMPRSALSYNVGKVLVRTLLPPAATHQSVPMLLAGRIPIGVDLGDHVGNDLFCLDTHYESTTLKLWSALARHAPVIVDLGSHIGTYSLLAADANPEADVIAVEADPDNFALLRAHCSRYANIRPVNAAVADRRRTMWFCHNEANSGSGSLKEEPMPGHRCHPIETHSLSSMCEALGVRTIDLIKIDVEGYEHTLLTENDEFWWQYQPKHVIAEIYRGQDRSPTAALFAAMRKRGYAARRVQGLFLVPRRTGEDLANWHFWR
jgi:FkbM family methyltransferase